MKRLIFLMLLLSISSCGKKDKDAKNSCGIDQGLVRTWREDTDSTSKITINNDCSYSGSYCGSTGQVLPMARNSLGDTRVMINISTVTLHLDECADPGSYVCTYELHDKYFDLDCGDGNENFTAE